MDRDFVAFCQRCGEPMETRPAFGCPRPVCTGCGFIHFQVTANAGVAIVVHRRRILLIERAIPPYQGRWGFPGGFQEFGESLADTAVRETREETGLDIVIDRVFRVGYTVDDPRRRVNVAMFLARPAVEEERVAARLEASDDASAVRFFSWSEMPSDDRIAFEHNLAVLRDLCQQFPTGDIR